MKARSGCAARWLPARARLRARASRSRRAQILCFVSRKSRRWSTRSAVRTTARTPPAFSTRSIFVDLLPKEKWRPVFHQDKERLIAAMDRELEKIPGVIWGFSQPISDNLEEAVSGVKGALAVKIYGDDLKTLEEKGDEIVDVMRPIPGVEDLGLFRVLGQPNLNFAVDREQAARLRNQCFRRAGCDSDRRRRQCADPGADRRAALRSGAALPAAISRHQGSDREDSPAGAYRRARLAGAADQGERDRRRIGNLSRGELAIRRRQVQRARPGPGQHRGRGHPKGQRRGEAAARLHARLGGRIRKPEALAAAAADRVADHDPGDLRHSLHHVQVGEMGAADPDQRGDGAASAACWRC